MLLSAHPSAGHGGEVLDVFWEDKLCLWRSGSWRQRELSQAGGVGNDHLQTAVTGLLDAELPSWPPLVLTGPVTSV